MSALGDPPFDEREQRFFLAEILKTSSMPPSDLVKIIQDRNINPNWMDMMMPNGRSPASCAKMFERLTNRVSSIIAPGLPAVVFDQPAHSQRPKKKRRPSAEVLQAAIDRNQQYAQPPPHPPMQVQPQQYYFAPVNVNETVDHAVHWNQSAPVLQGEQPVYHGKKRGRPSKAEYEVKAREAAERGDPWPPPKKIKTPRPSVESGNLLKESNEDATGQIGGQDMETTLTPKEKITRKTKSATAVPDDIPPRTSSVSAPRSAALEATATAAEQMQINAYREIIQSTNLETKSSERATSENLVGEMTTQNVLEMVQSAETPTIESKNEPMDARPATAQMNTETPQETDPTEERQERQSSPTNTN